MLWCVGIYHYVCGGISVCGDATPYRESGLVNDCACSFEAKQARQQARQRCRTVVVIRIRCLARSFRWHACMNRVHGVLYFSILLDVGNFTSTIWTFDVCCTGCRNPFHLPCSCYAYGMHEFGCPHCARRAHGLYGPMGIPFDLLHCRRNPHVSRI